MSLINDVLRDLGANRGHDDARIILEGTQQVIAVDPAGFPLARVTLAILLAVALAAGSIIAWQYLRHDPVITQPPAPTIAPAPPVVAQSPAPKAANATKRRPRSMPADAAESAKPAAESLAYQAPVVKKSVREPTPAAQAELDYRQAAEAIREGRAAEAETLLQQTITRLPDHLPSRLALADLWIRQQRLEPATDLLAEGFALQPQAVEQAWLYGRLLMQQGRDQEARTVLETTAPVATQYADYQALLGALYQRMSLNAQSAEQYRRAVRLKPDQAVWWMGLGMALEQLQQPAEARDAYRSGLQYPLSATLQHYMEGRIAALSR